MGFKVGIVAFFAILLAGCSSGEEDAPVPKATTPAATHEDPKDPSPLPPGLERHLPGASGK